MARTALSSGPHDSTSSPANRGNIERPEAAEGDDARVCPESGGPGGNEASPDPHTEAVHGRAHPPAFEIGIVMAGAISAGAYTAGVMDFLIQALDAWQRMKDSGKDVDCPRHDVKLKVISGASAGGMTAALAAGMLCEDFEHVVSDQVEGAANNKLFESWVRQIDIRRLLETRDLDDRSKPVRSFLDSSVLDEIAADAFDFPDGGPTPPHRPYLSDPLHVVLTLTNLRGVPYKIDLKGTRATNCQMRLHADRLHFVLSAGDEPSPPSFEPRWLTKRKYHRHGWAMLREAALATGAFPFGLAPRALHRRVLDYADRRWSIPGPFTRKGVHHCNEMWPIPPYWPDAMPDDYDFLCVDGGVIDNEPLELARQLLVDGESHSPRDGRKARRATLLIDPFPNATPFPVVDTDHRIDDVSSFSLFRLCRALLAGLINQARFKPEELELAARPDIYSRFLIEPVRYDGAGLNEMEYAVACGSVAGFGGFLAEKFRRHDYQLGRRNCQQFLRKHFVLPEDNPLFARWSPESRELHRVYRSKDGKEVRPLNHSEEDDDVPHLPIIPLVDDAADAVPCPSWPEYSVEELADLQRPLRHRLDRVVRRLVEQGGGGVPARVLLRMAWPFERGKVERSIFQKIRNDLEIRDLLPTDRGAGGVPGPPQAVSQLH